MANVTVSITGSYFDSTYGYVTINGTKYTSATSVEVSKGAEIAVCVGSNNTTAGTNCYIVKNGETVQSGQGTHTFTADGNVSIAMDKGSVRVTNMTRYYYFATITAESGGGGGTGGHSALIDLTTYGLTGGKTMVSGTDYDITLGRTLVAGTAYDIAFGSALDPVEILQTVSHEKIVGNNTASAKQLTLTIDETTNAFAVWSNGSVLEISKISNSAIAEVYVSTATNSTVKLSVGKGRLATGTNTIGTLALFGSSEPERLEELFGKMSATVLASNNSGSRSTVSYSKSKIAAGTILFGCRDTSYGFYLWDGSTLTPLFEQGSYGLEVDNSNVQAGPNTTYAGAIVKLTFDV